MFGRAKEIKICCCIIVILSLAASVNAATFLVNDDFNNETTGAKPNGYIIEEAGGKVEVVEVPDQANKSLFLIDLAAKNIKVTKQFEPQTVGVTAEVAFMQPALGSTAKVIRLMDREGQNVAVHIETRGNAKLAYKNSDGNFTEFSTYEANKWYQIKVVANIATQKADVYLNGEPRLAQMGFMAQVVNIGSFDSYTPGSSAKSHYLDNIKITAGAVSLSSDTVIKPLVEAKPTVSASPAIDSIITELSVKDSATADKWAIASNIQTDDQQFSDRAYLIASLPAAYAGYDWIKTSADAKKYFGEVLATFKLKTAADVLIAHDDRLVTKPAWLSTWKDTGEDILNTEPTPTRLSIYQKSYPAGAVVLLGPNGGSSGCLQYMIIVKGVGKVPGIKSAKGTSAPVKVVWSAALSQKPDWYGSAEAVRIADNVLLYQRNTGGWHKNIDMAEELTAPEKAALNQAKITPDSTIDNGSTTTQLQYLARVYHASKLERFKDGFIKGLDFLLQAQYSNGGWPQYYPDKSLYYAHITFNDEAMVNVMKLLREIVNNPNYQFVDAQRRFKAEQAIKKGIDCILKTQIKVNGKLTAWCAQHDENTLAPAPARSYELVSISGSESVGVVRFLMSIENPSPEIITAIKAAIAWFNEVKLTGIEVRQKNDPALARGFDRIVVQNPKAPPIWARFYEIGTNRPFFCGRDGVKKYQLAEIEYERRTGYDWYTMAPAYLIEKEYPAWLQKWSPAK